jgi:asparagine synthase (glutamine-hydrolysing)
MCGIAMIAGPEPDRAAFRQMIGSLAPRGEVEEVLLTGRLLAGTQRLRIVDAERAVQPFVSADGRWVLCYNGEVFNHRALQAELTSLGHRLRTDSDTEVVLEAFLEWGVDAVRRLRGEFAFALADTAADRVYLARDPLGVKPLYWSRCGASLQVASEVKALTGLGAPVSEVPPGHHGWAEGGAPDDGPAAAAGPSLLPYLDLLCLGADQPQIEDPAEAAKLIRAALEDNIRVRVDTDLTVGVILSGGLDSSLTLLHVREMHPDCVAFTIGARRSEDLAYARRRTGELGVPHEVIEVRPKDIRLADIREAIRLGELTEYGDIITRWCRCRCSGAFTSSESRWCSPATAPTSCSAATRCTSGPVSSRPGGCSCIRSGTCAGPSCSASTGPAWATPARCASRSWTCPWWSWPCGCPVSASCATGRRNGSSAKRSPTCCPATSGTGRRT